MIRVAEEFLGWSDRNTIDPKHWLVARHDAIKWSRRISIKKLPLKSGKFRRNYDEWVANKMAALDQEVLDRKKTQTDTSKVRSLTVLGESTKSALAQDPEACLVASKDLSGGWHPASDWCVNCCVASDCRSLLGERIAKLRLAEQGGRL